MALPPKATSSSVGEVLLCGDLTGNGASPQLVSTGVAAGKYTGVSYASIDAKGRFVSIGGVLSFPGSSFIADVYPYFGDASTSNKGFFSIKPSSGITVSSGQIGTAIATSIIQGTASIGMGLAMSSDTLNLNPASMTEASTIQKGLFQLGDNFSKSGSNIQHAVNPSSTDLGTYSVGSGFSILDGALIVAIAENTILGLSYVPISSKITLTSGDIDLAANFVRKNAFNVFSKSQNPVKSIQAAATSLTPNFTDTSSLEIELNQNVVLNVPTGTTVGGVYTMFLVQDSVGSRTVSLGSYRNVGGFAASTSPNAIDVVTIIHIDTSVFLFILNDRF